jgi:cadmium resistance protein CadD (predicted permease)
MFIGIVAFVVVALMAFWMLVFLMGVIPMWIGAYFMDKKNEGEETEEIATE